VLELDFFLGRRQCIVKASYVEKKQNIIIWKGGIISCFQPKATGAREADACVVVFNRHASRQSPRPSVIKNSGPLCSASSSASQSCQPQPVDRVKKGQPQATLQICRLRSITLGRTMETSLGQFLDRFLDSDCHQDYSVKYARSEWTDVLWRQFQKCDCLRLILPSPYFRPFGSFQSRWVMNHCV